jgi:hypothetical protein
MTYLLDTDTCVFWLRTNNTEHYGRVAQLTLENWTQP